MPKKRNTIVLVVMLLLILLLLTPLNGVAPTHVQVKPESGSNYDSAAPKGGNPSLGAKKLAVAVNLEPNQFDALQRLNQQYMSDHPLDVDITNVRSAYAYEQFVKQAKLGDAADVMLIPSEWVNKFAVSGFILPVDSFFSGVTASEPINIAMNQVKWNGYIWGIPKEIDPYVLVWNDRLLRELEMEHIPAEKEGWLNLERHLVKFPNPPYMLGADLEDGYEILSLMRRIGASNEALTSLETLKPYLYTAKGNSDVMWNMLVKGELLAMVTTNSQWLMHRTSDLSMEAVNIASEAKPYWVQSRSFVISAATNVEKEAREWIQAMTTSSAQELYREETNTLPSLKLMYTMSSVPALPERLRQMLINRTDLGVVNKPGRYEDMITLGTKFEQFSHAIAPLQSLTEYWIQVETEQAKDKSATEDIPNQKEKGTSSIDSSTGMTSPNTNP
ncbi:hypothetical protein BVG16_11230 [Paenibacillus selenitireducens]|uniref:ABC transporter substrate-binding protein n=1 Tax=Paenibacillus selenitireducens TaxID=1324314 RepID=A0A1T2XF56_9BACL|nr:extracellular solute-binding protein [Paenibacillus selenitireducens]OPA78442.1 hypothetical protein BVG16_11230 [Paenibacillus selenitireducens]